VASGSGQQVPLGQDELVTAVGRLIDLSNDQAKEGISHSGLLKEGVVLATGADLELFHGLGRVPRIVLSVMSTAGGVVQANVVPHALPRSFVNLRATVAGTYNVLVS
jgi:hypothetical protein